MRVLIVEDDNDSRRLLSTMVGAQGFEVVEAVDGEHAWNLVKDGQFQYPIVITDWLMPGMDGMGLVRAIRANEEQVYSYIIMLTGASEEDAFKRGMKAGADDLLRKPWHVEELLARLNVAARIMRLGRDLAAANRSLRRSNRTLEFFRERVMRELEAAARVQESLLPGRTPTHPGVKISWSLVACEELAGDVLNVLSLDDTHVGLYVLDVSGHGVSAALLSAQLSRLLNPEMTQSQLLKEPVDNGRGYELRAPRNVMAELNELFPMDPIHPQFFTLLYGILDTASRELTYCSAGHPGPIHQSRSGEARAIQVSGTPIGMLRSGSWVDAAVQLEPGDRLLLYSDGLLEAVSPEGQYFGDTRLMEILRDRRGEPIGTCCGAVMEDLENWCGTRRLQDDCSLLIVEIE